MKTRVNLKYFVNDSQLRMMSGFSNKISAKPYSIVESCSILSQNIVKSKSKFKFKISLFCSFENSVTEETHKN